MESVGHNKQQQLECKEFRRYAAVNQIQIRLSNP